MKRLALNRWIDLELLINNEGEKPLTGGKGNEFLITLRLIFKNWFKILKSRDVAWTLFLFIYPVVLFFWCLISEYNFFKNTCVTVFSLSKNIVRQFRKKYGHPAYLQWQPWSGQCKLLVVDIIYFNIKNVLVQSGAFYQIF